MKANELMVGDLCLVNRENLCIKKGTIVRISCIDADNRLKEKGLIGSTHCYPLDKDQDNGGIWCEYLDPIPLTPEILEKNGFKIVHGFGYSESYPTYGWGYHKGLRDFASVDVTFYDEPIGGVSRLVKMETASKKDDGINSIHSCDIEFIHQLQHALRLVGIEKEIVL